MHRPLIVRVCLLIGLLVAIFGGARLALVYLDQRWSHHHDDDVAIGMWFTGPERLVPERDRAEGLASDDPRRNDIRITRPDLFPIQRQTTPNRDRAFKAIVLIASGLAVATAAWVLPSRSSHPESP